MPFNDFERQSFVTSRKRPERLDKVAQNCNIAVNIGLGWQGVDCQFEDWLYLAHVDLARDRLPGPVYKQLPGKARGATIEQVSRVGELVAGWRAERQFTLPTAELTSARPDLSAVNASFGRFYPADYFPQASGQAGHQACRITELSAQRMTVDCNHPLSQHALRLMLQIEDIRAPDSGDDGPGRDIMALVCDLGPGMQDRLPQQETDFFCDRPFRRLDDNDDADFFRQPSLTPFWDRRALVEVSRLYRQLIRPGSAILDLMAGVHSPLQESNLDIAALSCAGLNAEELAQNPICDERRVLDVNKIQALPYPKQRFDAVLIHAAIEYVTQPQLLMREIARVLRPGGRIIISFSNRSLAQKAIQAWTSAYEFERSAIVLSYLRATGAFSNFHSHSQRGRLRPPDDILAAGLEYSDPVYLLWAEKTNDGSG